MNEEELEKCEVCGVEADQLDIEIFHRACRFKRAFPDAYEEKDGLLFFDPAKMREQLERSDSKQEPDEP